VSDSPVKAVAQPVAVELIIGLRGSVLSTVTFVQATISFKVLTCAPVSIQATLTESVYDILAVFAVIKRS
jgi:hypothetical protein